MKCKLLTTTFALLITQSAMASSMTMPFECPSVDTLKNIAISNIMDDKGPVPEYYGIELSNTYGTKTNWTFIIGGFEGKYRSEILAQANAAISSLTLESGPTESRRNEWTCIYKSNDGSVRYAAAVTPAQPFDTAGFAKILKK